MKQVPLTDSLRQKLTSLGADASKVAVFEATALNTLPVRKNHPLYKGGVHTRGFLQSMMSALNEESLPLQTQHDSEPLPIGRVFLGEVLDNAQGGSELRVLFWVDQTHQATIDLINNGTVDQVSVSTLPKAAVCSKCGFNFLGEDASFDNIWTGTCPDDHTMGKDGAHVIMDQLDRWFELSLVGQGGIQGARISTSADARLVADGSAASFLTLSVSSADLVRPLEKPKMDIDKLVNDLSDTRAQVIVLNNEKTSLVAERDAVRTDLSAKDAEVSRLTARVAELEATNTASVTATAALADIAKHVLTISGRVSDAVPEKVEDIVTLVKGTKLSIAAPVATPAEAPDATAAMRLNNGAFKRVR